MFHFFLLFVSYFYGDCVTCQDEPLVNKMSPPLGAMAVARWLAGVVFFLCVCLFLLFLSLSLRILVSTEFSLSRLPVIESTPFYGPPRP